MEFSQQLIYTGKEEKVSKKGNAYSVVHLLDTEGKAFSCMLEPTASINPTIKQLDKVKVNFSLKLGRYMSLSIKSLQHA